MDKYLSIHGEKVVFKYGKKEWRSTLGDIKDLGIARRKKILPLEDISVLVVTFISIYLMTQTDIEDAYFIVPTIIFYTFIIILKHRDYDKFRYFVILKETNGKIVKIKIEAYDRSTIGNEIGECLKIKFERDVIFNSKDD